ncbi:unnamed protein product [Amoebophrya sp. A120]|nr:unnamed protein product [Amoebophrya sp. A120]|eukprot:GSA120T00003635001.1
MAPGTVPFPRSPFSTMRFGLFIPLVFRITNAASDTGFSYDYSRHGADWVAGMCSSTERQSPVALTTAGLAPTGNLVYNYISDMEHGFPMLNNGHTITADFMGLGVGGLAYNNGWYNLLSVNFHSPSEHVYDGQHFPLEAHLVHKRSDSDHLVIVAVPFSGESGSAGSSGSSAGGGAAGSATAFLEKRREVVAHANKDNFLEEELSTSSTARRKQSAGSLLASFGLGIPANVGQTMFAAPPVDFAQFYGEGGEFVEYGGSLTAPPCAETATWFVRKEPVAGAEADVPKFATAIMQMTNGQGNNRQPMPLNGRPVALRTAVQENPPAAQPPASMSASGSQSEGEKQSQREYQALMWAKEAMEEAKAAKEYVKTLDDKLRASTPVDPTTGSSPAAAAAPAAAPTAAVVTDVSQVATPIQAR